MGSWESPSLGKSWVKTTTGEGGEEGKEEGVEGNEGRGGEEEIRESTVK